VFLDLAAVSAEAGMELSLLSLMPIEDSVFRDRLVDLGLKVGTLDLRSRWDLSGLARAKSLIADEPPDIVHTHLKHADLVGGYAARALGVPHVSTLHLIEHGLPLVGTAKRWAAARTRERSAAKIIAVSDAVRRWYLDLTSTDPRRVVRIYNGVRRPAPSSEGQKAALRRSLGVAEAATMISCVSLMRPEKGHADLLSAVALQRDRAALFVLAGDGPRRPYLEAQAAALGLGPERVRFLGFRDDVDALLAASDLVVQPSREDALPTTLIQALAAGVPAVATNVGGIPEIVTEEVAQLVPPGDVEALAASLDDAPRRLSRRPDVAASARARFEEYFEASGWARRLLETYTEVLTMQDTSRGGRRG
jgi:glycosyltransferase involved in cell wall biosynthesis